MPTQYSLSFDTNLNFRELVELLKKLGIPGNSRIISLILKGDETCTATGLRTRKHPITFSEIGPDLVELIMNYSSIDLELLTRPKSEWGKVLLMYTQQYKEEKPSEEKLIQRIIRYNDTQIQKPRFDQILNAAALELKPEERKMLEYVIEQSLRL